MARVQKQPHPSHAGVHSELDALDVFDELKAGQTASFDSSDRRG